MADPTFNLFGPISKNDVKVGYISTDRGYREGVGVCEANEYAKLNPGTTFIFKPDRKTVRFLNINEVNELADNPAEATKDQSCPEGLNMHSVPDATKLVFMGGGGIGAVANPVIGDDGALLAVDLVNGGFGYKYPPLVDVVDDSGIGAGAVVSVEVGNVEEQLIYYTDKEDFEDYQICDSNLPEDEYGKRYGPDGKDLGKWSPSEYTDGKVSFNRIIDEYIKKVQEAGKDWWTTRKTAPLKVTTTGQSSTSFFKVKHPAWGKFMNEYAISPKPPSNVKPSDFAGHWFTFEWNLDFPYDGEYIFRGAKDNKAKLYIENQPVDFELSHFKGATSTFKKTLKAGPKVLRLDLYNQPEKETVTLQQPLPPSTRDIKFKITTASMFSNGVTIKELNINEVKPFTPPGMGNKGQLNVTHTRKIEYGKKYKVVFSSKGSGGVQGDIKYTGLHPANETITVTRNGKRIELKDGHGSDTNFSLNITSKNGKFSSDGRKLEGGGNITITSSWNDNPNTAGVAIENIQIGDKTWRRTGRSGAQTQVVNMEGSGIKPNIRLRTKGSNVIQMEDFTDNDWADVIVTASGGQFTDLKGNVAYFSVPHPPKNVGKSTGSQGTQIREVFNTVDYITKANRQLWRTNVYNRGGFLNDYGICPFDTKLQLKDNPYAGDHTIVWPNVNFPIDGNYTIEVAVDDNVDLTIGDQVNLTKKGFIGDSSVSTGTLKTSRFIKGGNYNITAKLNQLAGGAFGFKAQDGKKKTKVNFSINVGGDYGNQITIPGILSLGKQYKGAGASMNQDREVEVGKEYDVIITTVRSRGQAASSDVRKGAIRFRKTKDNSGGLGQSGPRLEFEDLLGRAGSDSHRDVVASVSQGRFYGVNGNRCKFMVGESMKGINPMALAINIETEFSEKEVQSKKSWNENPMGVALTIESPDPPVPQQPVPLSEGRCPNNPFWTTRFPGAEERWYPVRFKAWGEMMNDHAISPLPPSDEGDARNDSGSFTNTWTKEFPYGGYYKVILSADNWGELWIDDEKVLDMGKGSGQSSFLSSVEKLIYIDGPDSPDDDPVSHEIKVVVENEKSLKTKRINAKVFSTLDWIGGGISKAENKRINFKITSASLFANGVHIPDLGIFAKKRYNGSQINKTFVRDVEVNRVYDVELTSTQSEGSQKNWGLKYEGLHAANNPIAVRRNNKRVELKDGHGSDTNASFTIDSGNVKFSDDGKKLIIKGGEATFTLAWNDNPNTAGVAINSIKIGDKTWRRTGRSGSITQTVKFARGGGTGNIMLKNDGESVVRMEDHTDASWDDVICSATEGRFFDSKPGANKATCKFVVSAATRASGGVSGSTTRNGVTYQGPHLFHYQDSRWGKVLNQSGVSPIGSPTQSLSDPNDNILGTKVLTWKNVDFPKTGKYDIIFVADNNAKLFIDDKQYMLAPDNYRTNEFKTIPIDVSKGKHDIKVELFNANHGYRKDATDNDKRFLSNPTGVSLQITTKMRIGTGEYKPWSVNPVGISAKLIPPPCPKKVEGKGRVQNPIVTDPGNGYKPPSTGGYPVLLKIKKAIPAGNPINFDCAKDKIRLEPSMGAELELVCGPFGTIKEIKVIKPGLGFTRMPSVIIDSDTGVNLDVILQFESDIAPFDVPDIIQVTDLVGLKQTGYYKGKPYYGAVFFENGVKYSGWYRTAGELVQVYDTMQESIDAMVTTPPSAILRQGSDVSSNDPRLNIPGTPDNLI